MAGNIRAWLVGLALALAAERCLAVRDAAWISSLGRTPESAQASADAGNGNFGTERSFPRGLKPTFAGYVNVSHDGSSIYYAYYESSSRCGEDVGEAPIVLWLQGGPGCASTFGGHYELGPWSVESDLGVTRNPGAWNRIFALLLVDQPVGSGYSVAANGSASIPTDELGMAGHLYAALQGFFARHRELQERPLIITGESYAGKYVPSIAHYILQVTDQQPDARAAQEGGAAQGPDAPEQEPGAAAAALVLAALERASATPKPAATQAASTATSTAASTAQPPALRALRALPRGLPKPLFRLSGLAVGNGLTDPRAQTQTLAAAAFYAGLLPPALRDEVAGRAAVVVNLIDEGQWVAAHTEREALRAFITNATGIATMFDTRRTEEYDPTKAVDRFLNLPEVKEMMRARPDVVYASCSDAVRKAMSGDVMRSVKALFPDILRRLPVLLYQGQYDILDGVASVTSWVSALAWDEAAEFNQQKGALWYLGGDDDATVRAARLCKRPQPRAPDQGHVPAGWRRSHGRLTHAVVYRAGHMVPHDQPLAAQQLLEDWVLTALD
ncbi:hypothetical protein HYH03_013956 [Edaphochlamys debaryana]|uniref:Carboxypeptidase n=1 Tax=Edaphochlamys debaryana TaxID=47281 RepID=A0A835XPW9_9CHLO|nr:hypothetical protein HYH03_013956 [Edaphochlamys debaryana]|eukprot:KAG2487387.1 hypothetical protein HYH03_013956 [Edaphochlamys debaryana]